MPYQQLDDLPGGVTNNLPKHAQEIYKAAFNSALKQYEEEYNTEEIAHRVAWSAVKEKYEKHGDSWRKK